MPKSKPIKLKMPKTITKETAEALGTYPLATYPVEFPKQNTQQVHFFSPSSSSEGGYDKGINALIKDGKRVVCMQLTREHLIVITE